MKNQLLTIFAIVDLFLITTTNAIANRDSALTEKKDCLEYNPEAESIIFAEYKMFSEELGGNKIRTEMSGAPCQGWIKDYYNNGQIRHKGYYVDGQVKIFKNYYDNGTIESSMKLKGHRKARVKLFHYNGNPKTVCNYMKGKPRKCGEFQYEGGVEIYVIKN